MGIIGLWSYLEGRGNCIQQRYGETLSVEVEGKTIAIDVATWLVQSRTEKSYENPRRHILVVFERIVHWLRTGVLPVLVFDGQVPPAKSDCFQKRYGIPLYQAGGAGFESRFTTMMEQTKALAQALGLPFVQSRGEAEATCALLNRIHKVDAVASNDGDALMYGARTMYKGLKLHIGLKLDDQGADLVDSQAVAAALGLDSGDGGVEEALVAVALISGADYLVGGIRNHGPAKAAEVVRVLQRRRRRRRRRQQQQQQQLEGGGPVPSLLDLLREALAIPVDAALVASNGACATCRRCRHGTARKEKHGTNGCEACGTHKRSKGGNGEGGCLPTPLLDGESCPCEPCRRKDDRTLHKLAAAATQTGDGSRDDGTGPGGIAAFLRRFDRARQGYTAALAEETVLRTLPAFKWERPNYEAVKTLLQAPLGTDGQGRANIARKLLPLFMEYDARYLGKVLGADTATALAAEEAGFMFLPVKVWSQPRLAGAASWRYEMRYRAVGQGLQIVAEAAAGEGLEMPVAPGAGCEAAEAARYEAALEKVMKKVLGDRRATLRVSLVKREFPALVQAFEEKTKRNTQSKTLNHYFPTVPSPARSAASASAASPPPPPPPPPPSSSSSSVPPKTPSAAAAGSARAAAPPHQAPAMSPASSPPSIYTINSTPSSRATPAAASTATIDLALDTPPSASASASASSSARAPPQTPAQPPRPADFIPGAPRKGKRPARRSVVELSWQREEEGEGEEEEEEGGFGSGARQDLSARFKRARRRHSGEMDEQEGGEEEDEEDWRLLNTSLSDLLAEARGGVGGVGAAVQAEAVAEAAAGAGGEEEEDEVEILAVVPGPMRGRGEGQGAVATPSRARRPEAVETVFVE
jgi:5'-3' exonuclease